MHEEVRIATYARRVDAELIRVGLEAAGIPGRLIDDSAMGENIAGFHLVVPASRVAKAMDVLDDLERPQVGSMVPSPAVIRARKLFRVVVYGLATLFFTVVVFLIAIG